MTPEGQRLVFNHVVDDGALLFRTTGGVPITINAGATFRSTCMAFTHRSDSAYIGEEHQLIVEKEAPPKIEGTVSQLAAVAARPVRKSIRPLHDFIDNPPAEPLTAVDRGRTLDLSLPEAGLWGLYVRVPGAPADAPRCVSVMSSSRDALSASS